MKFLYRTLKPLKLNGIPAILRVKTDGQQLYVTITPAVSGARPSSPMTLSVIYGGATRSCSSNPFGEMTVEFPYSDNVSMLRLSGPTVSYHDVARTEFQWSGSYADPDPAVTVHMNGVRGSEPARVHWNAARVEGRIVMPVLAEYCIHSGIEGYPAYCTTFDEVPTIRENPISVTLLNSLDPGRKVWARLSFALYDEASAQSPGENYRGITDVETEVHLVSTLSGRFVPRELIYRRPVLGAPLRIAWSEVNDVGMGGYELQRSVDGGEFAMIYRGTSLSFMDSVGDDWETLAYRVKTLGRDANFQDSYWHTGPEWVPLRSNLYVGHQGRVLPAVGMYVGQAGGVPAALTPVLSVG